MSFPFSPIDGQVYFNNLGTGYKFDSTRVAWLISSQTIIGLTGLQGPTGIIGETGAPDKIGEVLAV